MWSWKEGHLRDSSVSMARTAGWGMKQGMKPSDSVASRARRRPPLVDVDHVDDGPGELAEPVPEPHLVEGVNAARLQSVATKGSQEVMVALQQRDFHPAAGEQVGETRSRGACTDDDDSSDRHDALPYCLETSTSPRDWAERSRSPATAHSFCSRAVVRCSALFGSVPCFWEDRLGRAELQQLNRCSIVKYERNTNSNRWLGRCDQNLPTF